MSAQRRARLLALATLAVAVPAGLAMKAYGGPWVANRLTGAVYEVFWCLAIFAVRPRPRAAAPIAAGVLAATCALEASQLWRAAWLESIRSTFIGRALIGDTFGWGDFPYYVLGCAAAWLWMVGLARWSSCDG